MKGYERELEITEMDTETKKGHVIVTYIDGTKETFSVKDKKFLATKFKLVPVKNCMN